MFHGVIYFHCVTGYSLSSFNVKLKYLCSGKILTPFLNILVTFIYSVLSSGSPMIHILDFLDQSSNFLFCLNFQLFILLFWRFPESYLPCILWILFLTWLIISGNTSWGGRVLNGSRCFQPSLRFSAPPGLSSWYLVPLPPETFLRPTVRIWLLLFQFPFPPHFSLRSQFSPVKLFTVHLSFRCSPNVFILSTAVVFAPVLSL